MSTLNNSVQYISVIRPGEKVAKLVKRMHYVSFVGMFRSDLLRAYVLVMPRKMQNLRQVVPHHQRKAHQILRRLCTGDKLHRTLLWQIGNLKRQRTARALQTIIRLSRYMKRG